MGYSVYIHADLLEMVPPARRERQRIMEFIRSLATQPFTEGDYIDTDDTLRRRQIKIVGRYAITYWVDQPVKAVMVVSIALADR